MKKFLYLIICILVFLSTQPLRAEDTIKVLIVEGPNHSILSEKAESLGHINGEVLVNNHIYTGLIEVKRDKNGLHFINELPFEKYIEGVVDAETGEDWAEEALKAQAVASRTYATYQKELNSEKDFHVTSSVLHQVYKGDSLDYMVRQAVKDTSGEILTYDGKPIEAFYHSTCKGNTALPAEVWGKNYPYLKSVPCRGKDSPYEHWQRRFRLSEIEEALGLTGIKSIRVMRLTSTKRAKTIRVSTEETEVEISATDLRRLLGYRDLPSTQFSITIEKENVFFEGSGYGHGVGLSQWGSLELANEGKNYKEILEHYYPGTTIEKR